ncbi:MAG TPA: hypothetical protein VJY33_08160, partial [Isosphaeraceae bacterium]|nr:hypothetical protein [Isosphaeraceae bacterium]
SRRTVRTRGRSNLAAWVETLENRTLLTVQVGPITAVAGQTFNGQVATFGPNDLQGNITNFQATINWGGGLSIVTPGIITPGSNGGYVVTGSNTYPQVGNYTVTVSLTGLNGSTANGSGTASILDAPLSSVGRSFAPTKGSPFVGVVATFQSQNPYAVSSNFSAAIKWGDGAEDAGVIAPNGLGGFNVVGDHTYTSYGTFPTTVTIQSLAGPQSTIAIGQAVVTARPISLVATNIFPIANTAISPPVQVASFFDPDSTDTASDFTAVINWGDGTLGQVTVQGGTGGVYNVLAGRDPGYAASGNYTFVVTVTRTATNQQAVASGRADVSAAPSPLTPLGALIVPTASSSFTGTVGAFLDSNSAVAGDFTAAINWGDGTSTQGIVTADAIPGQFDVSGTHTYTTTGQYSPTILVQDNQGNGTTIQSTAVVIGTSEALTAVPALILASPGIGFSGAVGSFIDTFPNAQAGDFTGVITWGDGHTSPASFAVDPSLPNNFVISGTNTYATAGTFPVSIQLQDNSDHSLTVSSMAAVAGPTIIATGTTFTVTPGQPVPNSTIVANFTDSNPDASVSNLVATIAWGDGYTSTGSLSQNPTTKIYTVTGGHMYLNTAATMSYPVTVTIADPNGQSATANSTALVTGPSFQPIATQVLFTAGVAGPDAIGGTVPPIGSFYYNATLSAFVASINWGNGNTSTGTVKVSPANSSLYNVFGSNLYVAPGTYSPTIQV